MAEFYILEIKAEKLKKETSRIPKPPNFMSFTGNLQTEQALSNYVICCVIYYRKGLKDMVPSNTECTLKYRSFLVSIKIL